MAFAGSFRIHELCSRKETEFCAQTTLLWKNVTTGSVKIDRKEIQSLSIFVKSPKIDSGDRGQHSSVPVEQFHVSHCCC